MIWHCIKKIELSHGVFCLLQLADSHLDGTGGTVRILLFLSGFDSIKQLLSEKLLRMGVTTSTVSWIADDLSEMPQFVWLSGSLSGVISNTGAP